MSAFELNLQGVSAIGIGEVQRPLWVGGRLPSLATCLTRRFFASVCLIISCSPHALHYARMATWAWRAAQEVVQHAPRPGVSQSQS